MSLPEHYRHFRIFVADIDGTLVKKGGTLQPKMKKVIETLHENGVLIGLATGRPLDERVYDKFKEWGISFPVDFTLGLNGGEIWDRDRNTVERHHVLKKELVREIVEFMGPLDVNIVVFRAGYNHILARRMDRILRDSMVRNNSTAELVPDERFYEEDTGKVEIRYESEVEEEVMRAIAQHPNVNWIATKTSEGIVEFMDPAVNKGSALRYYCDEKGISLEDVIACGDMDNDASMLEIAGMSVCLSNGSEPAKKVSDFITEFPVEVDGLGIFFENEGII